MAFSLLFSKLPMQVAYFYNRMAKTSIHSFFRKHKVEHLFCQLIRVSEYLIDYKDCKKTLDYMDALSQGMERRVSKAPFYLKRIIRMEATRLKRYEHFIFKEFDHKIIISEQDRELIVHAKNEEIHIVRNGVDLEYFKAREANKEYDLLFTGNMSYPPNVDGVSFLVQEILPLVWKQKADVKLAIAGATPSPRVQKLAGEQVIVTGWVDDMRDYYAASRVFIAPMQIGTGLQNKLLEAMAMEIPCITSTLANNALKAVPGESIRIGKNPQDYADQILNLLEEPKMAEELAQAGKAFVASNYRWKHSTIQLDALFLNPNTKA